MVQDLLGEIPKITKLETLTKEELVKKYSHLEAEYFHALKEIYKLKQQNLTDSQLQLVMDEQLSELRSQLFESTSERYKRPENSNKKSPQSSEEPRRKRPSERYPHVPVKEVVIDILPPPSCTACGEEMMDSKMTEDSEQLTVIPKKFEIILQKRKKYRCQCQGCLITVPAPPRIIEGSAYSDEMIMDVALSKYCDLIPIERYVAMASRSGVSDIPPHSLINLTHQFADFIEGVYKLLKTEILNSRVLRADETPHKMLEGSDKKSWYLWGFSTPEVCYLECRDTRSGDVASEVLLNSRCEVILTDVYAGYSKAVTEVNQARADKNLYLTLNSNQKSESSVVSELNLQNIVQYPMIKNAYCNAHARRNFFKLRVKFPEACFYLDEYAEIYALNKESKGKPPDEVLKLREKMKTHFEKMRDRALTEVNRYSTKMKYYGALMYFLNNYSGLTLFLTDVDIPIDNNAQESLLRSHVVGRKTWYGTHSERGAKTAAVLFSLTETCKLNKVNPRKYFENLVKDLLQGKNPYTPKQYKDLHENKTF
jgi:transposase